MTVLAPIWLFLLIPLGVALWIWRPPTVFLLVVRMISIVLIVLAMAGLSLKLPSRAGTVVILADRSLSMPQNSGVEQKSVIDFVRESMGGDDRIAVVAFGQRSEIELAPGFAKFGNFAHEVGGSASNLTDALEMGLSLIPQNTPGRILILSDGKWTGRDPVPLASTALARNIAIDYRSLERTGAGDLAIARVDAPTIVSAGESYLITGWVFAPTPQAVTFTLKRGPVVLSQGERQLNSGMNRLTFRDRAIVLGNQAYSLTVETIPPKGEKIDPDPVPENNTAKFLIGVSGPRPILHMATSKSSGLARLLAAGGLDIQVGDPDRFRWTLEELSRYSAVILENFPAEKIGHVGMETLAAWVKETGGGLMMTGGQSSYAPGGYYKSPLDEILPVSMELRNEHRKLSLSMVVALDRSGSMAAPVSGGKVKMDLANLGTAQVLDMLGPMDEFGCIAIDSEVHSIVPIGRLTDKAGSRAKILKINSQGGGIYVYKALAASAEMLLKAKSGTKHIILFSDAADSEEPGDYKTLLSKCERAGITVSVIGLGTDRDVDANLLKDIAKRGRGRIFFTDKPEELPRLFAQDTFVVARNTFIDEPVSIKHMAGLSTLMERTLPIPASLRLGGYNLTYLKEKATVGTITQDEYKAPVVAAWRAGSGRVSCYTGEADGKYAGSMPKWEHVGDYFTSMTRWTAGAANPLRDNMLLTQEVRDGINHVQLHLDPERKGESFAGLPGVSILRSMPGEVPRVEKKKMRWIGADLLALEVPLDGGETSISTVEIPGLDAVPMPPVCLPYSPEFKPTERDRGLVTLERLGRATAGQERLDLAGIWKDLPRQAQYLSIARWLLLAAVVFLLLEVFERRTSMISSMLRRRKVEESGEFDNLADDTTELKSAVVRKGKAATLQLPETPSNEPAPVIPTEIEKAGLMDALRKARRKAKGRTEQ